MKIQIQKKAVVGRKTKRKFQISRRQFSAIEELDRWLAENEDFTGKLPWHDDLCRKIENEILARERAPRKDYMDFQVIIPLELSNRMKRSECVYNSKGYLIDWDAHIRNCLNKIIRDYTCQLEKIIGKEAPPALREFALEYRRKVKKSNTVRTQIDKSLDGDVSV